MFKTYKFTIQRTIQQTFTVEQCGFNITDATAVVNQKLREEVIIPEELDNLEEEILFDNIASIELIKDVE